MGWEGVDGEVVEKVCLFALAVWIRRCGYGDLDGLGEYG
jgi:hypothetical protein